MQYNNNNSNVQEHSEKISKPVFLIGQTSTNTTEYQAAKKAPKNIKKKYLIQIPKGSIFWPCRYLFLDFDIIDIRTIWSAQIFLCYIQAKKNSKPPDIQIKYYHNNCTVVSVEWKCQHNFNDIALCCFLIFLCVWKGFRYVHIFMRLKKHKHTVLFYCFNKHVMESDFINK